LPSLKRLMENTGALYLRKVMQTLTLTRNNFLLAYTCEVM
jgi:hypothetical protein